MLYAIKKRGFLQIFGSVGVSTLNGIDTHQYGKNVVVPHGNLSSPNGNVILSNSVGGLGTKKAGTYSIYLEISQKQWGSHLIKTTILKKERGTHCIYFATQKRENGLHRILNTFTNISTGTNSIQNSIFSSLQGAYNTFFLRGGMLSFPSENNVLLPSGESLSLPPVFLGTKKAGTYAIYVAFSQKQWGSHLIKTTILKKERGTHCIYFTTQKRESGLHRLQNTFTNISTGTNSIQNSVFSSLQGAFNIFYFRGKSLLFPSENNVLSPSGESLSLPPVFLETKKAGTYSIYVEILSNSHVGTHGIQSSVLRGATGDYNVFYFRGSMLLFPSGNSALLPNGDSLALPPISIERSERGTHKIKNFFGQEERGFHRIYSSVSRGQRGQHIIKAYVSNSFRGIHKIRNAFASLKQGFFRLYLSAIQKQWGASFVKGTVSSGVTGKHSIYAPLSRRETGEFQIIKGLPISVVGGYRTFGRASKEEQGTHSIYASSLERSAQGNFNLFYIRGYKLNFSSGYAVQLPGGDYLALQGDAVSSSQMGAHRTYVSVRARKVGNLRLYKEYKSGQIGAFNVFYFRGRSLFFPSANAITLPQGDYLALPSEVMADAKSGTHRVYNLKLRRPLGSFKLYNSLGQAQQGEYNVYRALLSAQTGSYIVESISTFSKLGTYNIRQDNALQLESGYWLRKDLGIKKQGRFRVENADKSGYLIYIGYGSMPDLTGPADAFSPALPTSVSVTPPANGEQEIFVVVRSRNSFNLVSQNQKPLTFLLDSNGDEVLGPLTTPSEVGIACITDDGFLVTARYEGYFNDRNKANRWEVYLKAENPPVVGVDAPAATGNIRGAEMQTAIGPYPETDLTYYLIVAVRRTADNTVATIATEIFVPAAPAMPLGL